MAGTSSGGEEAVSPGPIAFEDAVLVTRFRQGDMQAFGALVAKYQDRIFTMVLRMCPNRAEAEELAQEAFLRAMERIDQFRGQSRFYTWLFRIAANLTLSHRRRAGRVKFRSMDLLDESGGSQAANLADEAAGRHVVRPDEAAMALETRHRVLGAMDELDDEFRIVLVLRDIEEMDYDQIAQVLDLPAGTVKSRLHRARCALKEKLADLVGEA
ncbi:MAG: sigma-70 family RNA polymerase sigma factor [Planctomycetota bacterium]|nr:sigma-70 family RNA polymerase sigma factor [Planctomycetota bacterium]